MLEVRVADGSLMRLIGKCLHVGVLEGVELSKSETGTAQGSVRSPLLGNVYLHYVLDLWFEQEVKPRLRGRANLVRYADDFIIGFETEDDARRVMEVLGKRLEHYGLTLHPETTRLLPFRRPPAGRTRGKGPATFDFLGFTFYGARTRKGRWGMTCKTRSASLRRFIGSVYDWCRRHRHLPVAVQHKALKRRIQGHFIEAAMSTSRRAWNPGLDSPVCVSVCVGRAHICRFGPIAPHGRRRHRASWAPGGA